MSLVIIPIKFISKKGGKLRKFNAGKINDSMLHAPTVYIPIIKNRKVYALFFMYESDKLMKNPPFYRWDCVFGTKRVQSKTLTLLLNTAKGDMLK